jgi:predicted esterase
MNEESLVVAARHFEVLDARFRHVPVFLHAGVNDGVAPPETQRAIAEALRQQGFEVRAVSSTGGHEVDAAPLRGALDWFSGSAR